MPTQGSPGLLAQELLPASASPPAPARAGKETPKPRILQVHGLFLKAHEVGQI